MAQWSRAFAALEDDYSLIPRPASQFCNSSSRKAIPWSGSGGYQACTCCPYTQAGKTPAENINKQQINRISKYSNYTEIPSPKN